MKVGFISDLHLDKFEDMDVFKRALIRYIKDSCLDYLIFGGDIYEDCYEVILLVKELSIKSGITIKYIYGNHDIWNKKNGFDTAQILKIYSLDDNCLVGKELKLGDYTLVSGMLWYDFSLASGDFSYEELVRGEYMDMHWKDSLYTNFDESYFSLTKRLNRELRDLIKRNKKVILLTHMINDEYYIGDTDKDERWKFFNGYLGSKEGIDLAKMEQVEIAVCGHIHSRKYFEKNGTRYICACFENLQEKDRNDEDAIYKEIKDSLYILEI